MVLLMNARNVTSSALKLIGIAILVSRTDYLFSFAAGAAFFRIHEWDGWTSYTQLVLFVAIPVAYIVFCLFIIVRSDWLAVRLIPEKDNDATIEIADVRMKHLETLALATVGLALLASAVPSTVQYLMNIFFQISIENIPASYSILFSS